jgi:hypothetical protein
MHPRLMGAAATLAFGTLAGSSALQAPPGAGAEPNWLSSYGEAQAVARHSHKPIFLVFR